MRIAELSQRTGVPIPTIKFYLREHLLPPGELTSPNQAQYGETHVHRLRLVRALVEVGGLSISATREVLTRMRAATNTLHSIGKAQFAIADPVEPHEDEAWHDAVRRVDELVAERGWQVRDSNPARASLAEALAYLTRLGHGDLFPLLRHYASAAELLAVSEVDVVLSRENVDSMSETLVTMSVLGDAMMSALRMMAQESDATRRFEEP
ncbi:MerR family transcriptional regulator [Actinophytocola gossypii]|uniref:MerR family transcriptional regulator n=1 Tax=Actinophytocola gossypii TaxID=2812003 RepID=A0ABT2J951_9PSEU|nr:MerR family transcriptional regulator [Actinophytocola gossypii]MCT2583975.1 MerR family transcriptional regulator [Actinophytocola gossypii]